MRVMTWPAALLCGMALALPLAAQEEPVPSEPPPPPPVETPAATETTPAASVTAPASKGTEPPLHRWGAWTVSVAAWEPALISADEEIAGTFEDGRLVPVMAGGSGRIRESVEIAYHFPRDAGSIVGHFESMYQDDLIEAFTPGVFNFLETRGFPFALGAFDDGLADGVRSSALRKTRDFRLEFAKKAFDSKWARGTFRFGYRQVSHDRSLAITSFAIVPNLPPLIPPVVGDDEDPLRLAPIPDTVSQRSSFFGHGIGAALDLDFPLHRRFSVISGLSFGLIRGDSESSYVSQSSYYFLSPFEDVPLTRAQLFAILSSGVPNASQDVHQAVVVVAVNQTATPQLAVTYDVYVGVQGTVYRGLKVFATLRQVYYSNVGEYVVPTSSGLSTRTPLNVGYEGFNIGLSWRF